MRTKQFFRSFSKKTALRTILDISVGFPMVGVMTLNDIDESKLVLCALLIFLSCSLGAFYIMKARPIIVKWEVR